MIETKIRKAIAVQFGLGDAPVNLDAPLSEYDADSLDLVELVMTIEDELEIEIPDEEFVAVTLGTKPTELTGRKLVELATKIKG
jgi:acyl carrier protein